MQPRDFCKILRDPDGAQVMVTIISLTGQSYFPDEMLAGIVLRTDFVGDIDPVMIFPYFTFERAYEAFETTDDEQWITTAYKLKQSTIEEYHESLSS